MPEPEKIDTGMVTITIQLSKEEHDKLQELARIKGETEKNHKGTIEECIRRFARTCQPGGSGWQHPANTSTSPKAG